MYQLTSTICFFLFIFSVSSYGWVNWNVQNSPIPSDNVTDVAVDVNNKVWISTYNGVASFDGTNWNIYDVNNSSIPNNICYSIACEGSNVWIGSVWGLVHFDGINSWTVYTTLNSGLPFNYITNIDIDSNGTKWISTLDNFGTNGGGLTKYDGISWTVYNVNNSGISSDWTFGTYVDENNIVWTGTNSGLNIFNDTSWSVLTPFNSGLAGLTVSDTRKDAHNIYWIATTSGLNRYNQDSSVWVTFNTGNVLPSNHINTIEIDRKNRKWVSCLSHGLAMFNDTVWTYYDSSNVDSFVTYVNHIAFDNHDNAWFATHNGLVFIGDSLMLQIVSQKDPIFVFTYPNPCTNILHVDLLENHGNSQLIIFSSSGSIVLRCALSNLENEVDVTFLSAGLYHIRVLGNRINSSFSIIKN